jgi:hypothetical protein
MRKNWVAWLNKSGTSYTSYKRLSLSRKSELWAKYVKGVKPEAI